MVKTARSKQVRTSVPVEKRDITGDTTIGYPLRYVTRLSVDNGATSPTDGVSRARTQSRSSIPPAGVPLASSNADERMSTPRRVENNHRKEPSDQQVLNDNKATRMSMRSMTLSFLLRRDSKLHADGGARRATYTSGILDHAQATNSSDQVEHDHAHPGSSALQRMKTLLKRKSRSHNQDANVALTSSTTRTSSSGNAGNHDENTTAAHDAVIKEETRSAACDSAQQSEEHGCHTPSASSCYSQESNHLPSKSTNAAETAEEHAASITGRPPTRFSASDYEVEIHTEPAPRSENLSPLQQQTSSREISDLIRSRSMASEHDSDMEPLSPTHREDKLEAGIRTHRPWSSDTVNDTSSEDENHPVMRDSLREPRDEEVPDVDIDSLIKEYEDLVDSSREQDAADEDVATDEEREEISSQAIIRIEKFGGEIQPPAFGSTRFRKALQVDTDDEQSDREHLNDISRTSVPHPHPPTRRDPNTPFIRHYAQATNERWYTHAAPSTHLVEPEDNKALENIFTRNNPRVGTVVRSVVRKRTHVVGRERDLVTERVTANQRQKEAWS